MPTMTLKPIASIETRLQSRAAHHSQEQPGSPAFPVMNGPLGAMIQPILLLTRTIVCLKILTLTAYRSTTVL